MAAKRNVPTTIKLTQSAFPVKTLSKMPVFADKGRMKYAWEELRKPKQFKEFDRQSFGNALQSAKSWGKDHGVEFGTLPVTGEDGKIIMSDAIMYDGKEITAEEQADLIEQNEKNAKLITVKQKPAAYMIIRRTPAIVAAKTEEAA